MSARLREKQKRIAKLRQKRKRSSRLRPRPRQSVWPRRRQKPSVLRKRRKNAASVKRSKRSAGLLRKRRGNSAQRRKPRPSVLQMRRKNARRRKPQTWRDRFVNGKRPSAGPKNRQNTSGSNAKKRKRIAGHTKRQSPKDFLRIEMTTSVRVLTAVSGWFSSRFPFSGLPFGLHALTRSDASLFVIRNCTFRKGRRCALRRVLMLPLPSIVKPYA